MSDIVPIAHQMRENARSKVRGAVETILNDPGSTWSSKCIKKAVNVAVKMSSALWRPIAPAPDTPLQTTSPSPKSRSTSKVACNACRRKKAKVHNTCRARQVSNSDGMQCDTSRPVCLRCKTMDLTCQYDVGEGVGRAERFKVLKDRQAARTSNLERLVELLRSDCDVQASTVLARLRLGHRVEDIVQQSEGDPLPDSLELGGKRYDNSP